MDEVIQRQLAVEENAGRAREDVEAAFARGLADGVRICGPRRRRERPWPRLVAAYLHGFALGVHAHLSTPVAQTPLARSVFATRPDAFAPPHTR